MAAPDSAELLPLRKADKDDDESADPEAIYTPVETWETVKLLPPLLPPERCQLCGERCLGCLLVGLLISMFVGLTMLMASASHSESDAARFCKGLILTEAIIAISCLFTIQYSSIGVIRRTPETCFPMPAQIVDRLQKTRLQHSTLAGGLRAAVSGMHNITDPLDDDRVFCVRCFVWRREDGHHCSDCQRCVDDFDHHCGVLGACIHGRGLSGNMWMFTTLISMAGFGLVTMLLTPVLIAAPASKEVSLQTFVVWTVGLLVVLPAACCFGYKGFMWFFYDRHAGKRVNKRRSV